MALSNGNRFYKDLVLSRLGLDSGREAAVDDLKSQVKQLIRDKSIIPPIPIICERVVELIRHAASTARMWRDEGLESIWRFQYGTYEAREYLDAFVNIQNHPFVMVNATQPAGTISLNLGQIIPQLRYLVDHNASIADNTLPNFEERGQPMVHRAGGMWIWDRFAPDQLAQRLVKLYSVLPKLYRQMVIQNFPDLGAYLWHFHAYPFKYFVRFHLQFGGEGSGMALYWLPVSSEEETTADVKYVERGLQLTEKESERIHEEYVVRLKAFGRFTGRYRFEETESMSLSSIAGKTPISDEVFDLLQGDMKDLLD
jgi:hypothetical protein